MKSAQAIPFGSVKMKSGNSDSKCWTGFEIPGLQHQWLSITMQYSSKLAMRVLPVLNKYYALYDKPPELIAMGFAAYLLFMRPVKRENDKYFGILDNQYYLIHDDRAHYFYGLWDERSVDTIVTKVLSNTDLWNEDLTRLEGFAEAVAKKLKSFIRRGTLQEIACLFKTR